MKHVFMVIFISAAVGISAEQPVDIDVQIQLMDVNSDGKISREEMVSSSQKEARIAEEEFNQSRIESRFNEMDADGDGYITRSEMSDWNALKERARQSSLESGVIVQFFDKNGDGKVSTNEFYDVWGHSNSSNLTETVLKQEFDRIDDDGDGYLSGSELIELKKPKN